MDSTEGQGKKPTIQSHVGQQEAREVRQREENARQEQRFRALQHQFNLLQGEVHTRTTPVPDSELVDPEPPEDDTPLQAALSNSSVTQPYVSTGQSHFHEPRLEKLTDDDDVEHFLITFERIALACRWQKNDWVFHLLPLLTGKARGANVHRDIDESLDYDKVKTAILDKYDINPETYRQRFRSLDINPDESPKELYARLKELYAKWINPKGKTVQEVGEIIILE